MQDQSTEKRIRDWIVNNVLLSEGDLPIQDNESLLDAGLIDSLAVMELVMFVRTEFHIDIAPIDVTPANFDSIAGIAAYVARKASPIAA